MRKYTILFIFLSCCNFQEDNDPIAPMIQIDICKMNNPLSDCQVDFGETSLSEHVDREIIISDTSALELVLEDSKISTGNELDYELLTIFPKTINPGQSVKIEIRFAPLNSGPSISILSFTTNAINLVEGNLVEIALTGSALE